MSALKRKNIASRNVVDPLPEIGASFLPFAMSALPSNGEVYNIELNKLSPSPNEWNFYSPLSDDKMLELIASIEANGLFHPIVVWKRNEEHFILSGHNRVSAYRRLYQQTGDDLYRKIPCVIKKDITEKQAREIIIDSNWVSRTLSVSEKTRSIYHKYVLLSGDKAARNGKNSYEAIAENYGLSGRQIHRYLQLGRLIEPILKRIDVGLLSLRSGVILSDFSEEIQSRLIEEYGNALTNKVVASFKKEMQYEDLAALIDGGTKKVTISFSVPEQQADALREMVQKIINEQLCK